MFQRELIFEYESVLTGKKNNISSYLFSQGNYENERKALYIIDYAIQTYLGWTPEEVRDHMNNDILKKLHLTKLLSYIDFPATIQIQNDEDVFYLAVKLYPDKIHYNKTDLILRVYKRVMNGSIQRFPKEYLSDADGLYRAKICFRFMMRQYLTFSSVDEMYSFFASKSGSRELRKYRLASVSRDLFETHIDFLHESLPDSQKDDLLYAYYKFQILYSK